MKDEIAKEVVKVVASSKNTLETALFEIVESTIKAKDFLIAELPDVVSQLLLWKFYQTFIYFGFGLCVFISFPFFIYFMFKGVDWDEGDSFMPCILISAVGGFILLVFAGHAINITWLQIWVAPKVYLIEYMSNLIK